MAQTVNDIIEDAANAGPARVSSDHAMPDFSLRGHVAVVTGSSSGIGAALAAAFRAAGADVVGVARRPSAEPDGDALPVGTGRLAHVAVDLLAVDDFSALAADVAAPFGPPTLLINAAGINLREPAEQVTRTSWDRTVALNLTVPFMLAQALVPGMRAGSAILNIASLQSSRAFANGIAYGASKGGVSQLTRAMAQAWGPAGIRANALAPGFFPTALTAAVFDDQAAVDRLAAQTCLGRNGALDDLTGPAIFLCSDAARYVTGQVLYVDGGFTAK